MRSMVHPRHVLCALGRWTNLTPVSRIIRSIGADFEMDVTYSQLKADPRMVGAFEASADRVKPSLRKEDREAIRNHTAVVYVLSSPLGEDAQDVSVRALALVQALLDGGATAIKNDSAGIAHGVARWRSLAARAAAASARSANENLERASALYGAWVRRPIRDGTLLYSCGMQLLGERDIEIPASPQLSTDLDWMDLLALYLLAEKPSRGLTSGEGFRQRPDGERRVLHLRSCERYQPDNFSYNPYGYWQLRRQGEEPE
jgi:hypothetical protein